MLSVGKLSPAAHVKLKVYAKVNQRIHGLCQTKGSHNSLPIFPLNYKYTSRSMWFALEIGE